MIRIPDSPPKYRLGQLVRHCKYSYRGVIVAHDTQCRADETWYQSNRTQPKRSPPWYHVLVDQSDSVTYAAEENLEVDTEIRPVHHPLVPHFFAAFLLGQYIRNDEPWPD